MDSSSIMEGGVKFRDGKKWKSRWCVMSKLSPVADCLHLQLYRDSKDRYKNGLTKASLSLQHFLGLESGFTLDKESNTIAIVCQDLTVVLAFDSRERLIQWQVKIYGNLPEGQQYLIQISSSPAKAKISNGPARLHIQDGKFCLTTGVPPKLAGYWEFKHLRRFGVVDGKLCFEGGSLSGKGEGVYVLLTDQGNEISRSMHLASEGRLEIKRKPLIRNATVHDSPCHKPVNLFPDHRPSENNFADRCVQNSIVQIPTSRHSQLSENLVWPSVEMQSEFYGHGDASSLGDLTAECQGHRSRGMWLPESTLGRCSSCIGKLGLPSRPSTAANTPASITFNPIWITEENKNTCFNTILNEEFVHNSVIVSHHNCTKYTTTEKCESTASQSLHCHYSQVENVDFHNSRQTSTPQIQRPSALHYRSESCSPPPPCRPPKPPKYRNLELSLNSMQTPKKLNKPPMPLPVEEHQECRCNFHKLKDSVCSSNHDKQMTTSVQGNNSNEYNYDTPRNIKVPAPLGNYDVPPPAVPVQNASCKCHVRPRSSTETVVAEKYGKHDPCVLHNIMCPLHSEHWIELPVQLNPLMKYNVLPPISKAMIPPATRFDTMRLCNRKTTSKPEHQTCRNEIPVYATVDLSKKTKRRNTQIQLVDVDGTAKDETNNDYTNVRFRNEEDNYRHIGQLNYMNLEFTNSLIYYENVKELLNRNNQKKIEGLNIDIGNRLQSELSALEPVHICMKCGHSALIPSTKIEPNCHREATFNETCAASLVRRRMNNNYVLMSPLKLTGDTRNVDIAEKSASNSDLSGAIIPDRRKKICEEVNDKYSMITTDSNNIADSAVIVNYDNVDGGCKNNEENFTGNDDNETISRLEMTVHKRSTSENGEQRPASEEVSSGKTTSDLDVKSTIGSRGNLVNGRKDVVPPVITGIRRLSNIGCKSSSNRDSSSSNDSGFSTGSIKFHGQDFTDFEMPPTTAISSKRHHSLNQQVSSNSRCFSMPRSKSSDPIKDLPFQFRRAVSMAPKSSSAEAELPLCLNKQKCCKAECMSPAENTIIVADCRSTSSGTSDMSDYMETLSFSSYGSSDVTTDNFRVHAAAVTTLRPRSGKEYQKIDRLSLLNSNLSQQKDASGRSQNSSPIVDKGESSSSGYSSTSTITHQ